ncbi:MAG: hypothetical protein QM734_14630 [Cyclobacteriaceae bacterium]
MPNFIAEGKNDDIDNLYNGTHSGLTPRNAEWLFNEIQGIPNAINCSQSCTTNYDALLSVPSQICSSSPIGINGLQQGESVSWSTTGSILSVSPTSPSYAMATRNNGLNGNVVIIPKVTNKCGTAPVSPAKVYVGGPSFNYISYDGSAGAYPFCEGGTIPYTAMQDHIVSVEAEGGGSYITFSIVNLGGKYGGVSGSQLYPPNLILYLNQVQSIFQ